VQGSDGNFYGTTHLDGPNGAGTVFKISPSGKLTSLHSFCSVGPDCADGGHSFASLVQATDGNFYGTTFDGGAQYRGVVFRISPGGVIATLYSFCSQSNCADGSYPEAGLLQATNGIFYGVTVYGGTNDSACTSFAGPCGTVFSLSTGLSPFVSFVRRWRRLSPTAATSRSPLRQSKLPEQTAAILARPATVLHRCHQTTVARSA